MAIDNVGQITAIISNQLFYSVWRNDRRRVSRPHTIWLFFIYLRNFYQLFIDLEPLLIKPVGLGQRKLSEKVAEKVNEPMVYVLVSYTIQGRWKQGKTAITAVIPAVLRQSRRGSSRILIIVQMIIQPRSPITITANNHFHSCRN